MRTWLLLLYVCTSARFVYGVLKLQILHTNDMHARFLEVDESTVTCNAALSQANKCYGGFARIRQAAIDATESAKKQGIPSILLNAGDTFHGTPYYSAYKWEIAAPLTDAIQFDAMSLGNHEFDDGIDNLVQYLTHIRAPTISTNLDFASEPRLNETTVKKSIVLNVGGLKIGIVGYLTPDTLKISNTKNLRILDEIPSLREEARRLKSEGTCLVIALGHSGFLKDQDVAKEVEDIDVIVGAHSHSLLYTPKDKPPSNEPVEEAYPFWVTQKSGKKVPIVQSSAFTKYFGKLMVTLDDTGKVIDAQGNSILLDYTHAKNPDLEKLVQSWTAKLDGLDTVLGSTRVSLKRSNLNSAFIESTFLNLITDSFIEKSVFIAETRNSNQWTRHAVAFFLNSGIRAEIDHTRNGGNITTGDLYTALPFKNQIRECTLNGSAIKAALEISVEHIDPNQIGFDISVLHFSGLRVVYDLQQAPKSRVHSVQIICTECSVPQYENLDDKKEYLIIADSYILSQNQEYSTLGRNCINETQFDPSTPTTAEIVTEYIRRHQIIYPKLDGRIQIRGYGGV